MNRSDVSVVIPTRGNVDLSPILDSLHGFHQVIIWDNSERENLGLYGRYAAIVDAETDVIATQDDDLVVTCWDTLLEEYEPGRVLCNYPEPWNIPWVARGALFHRDAPARAFERYLNVYDIDRDFTHYMCDGVFTLLSDCKVVDHGSTDLPWCNDTGRISTEPGWYDDRRPKIIERCNQLLGVAA